MIFSAPTFMVTVPALLFTRPMPLPASEPSSMVPLQPPLNRMRELVPLFNTHAALALPAEALFHWNAALAALTVNVPE